MGLRFLSGEIKQEGLPSCVGTCGAREAAGYQAEAKEGMLIWGSRRGVAQKRVHGANGIQAELITKAAKVGKSKKGQEEISSERLYKNHSRLFPLQ